VVARFPPTTIVDAGRLDALERYGNDIAAGPAAVAESMRTFALTYRLPCGGYGGMFRYWLMSADPRPYGSYGNGSAMRVSAVGWLDPTLELTQRWAAVTAGVTHNHPEGIKGAQATAAAI
jgi:ADP-ribosylglycohydrolase